MEQIKKLCFLRYHTMQSCGSGVLNKIVVELNEVYFRNNYQF